MDYLNLFVYSPSLKLVGYKLLKQPFLILKPKSSFIEDDPLYFEFFLLFVFTAFSYIQTKRTDNLSVVDRLWSVVPVVYAFGFLIHDMYKNISNNNFILHERLSLVVLLVFGWGMRLSWNLYIKNGYKKGHEDYRWELIRTWFTGRPKTYELFVLFIVCLWQMISIWMFVSLPLYIIYKGDRSLKMLDFVLVLLFLVFLFIETLADLQMYSFQERKKKIIKDRSYKQIDPTFNEGFCREGLYKYSRHPNYFGELGQWFTIFLFSCVNIGINWSIIGFLNLSYIFYRSLIITEGISTFKYPRYKYYAKGCNKLIPWFSTDKYIMSKRQ